MAKFSAYLDESGHYDDSEFIVVAGCIADVDQWVHLEREWKSALNPVDPQNAKIFHFTECADDALKMRLARIITRRVEKTVAIAIPLKKFKAMNIKYLFAECIGYPYPLAAWYCVQEFHAWADHHNIQEQIEFVFEDGALHKGQLKWLATRDGLPIPVFKKKAECVTLQAGDLVAGEIRRSLDESHVFGSLKSTPILDHFETHSHVWGGIDQLVDEPELYAEVFAIPVRYESLRYKSTIFRLDGRNKAVVHSWSKDKPNEILKTAIKLPSFDQPLTQELMLHRIEEYKKKSHP